MNLTSGSPRLAPAGVQEDLRLRRLLWRCRRGMKELDLLLERFARQGLPGAPQGQWRTFETLLTLPDPLLADYLLGGAVAPDPAVADLVTRIRSGLNFCGEFQSIRDGNAR